MRRWDNTQHEGPPPAGQAHLSERRLELNERQNSRYRHENGQCDGDSEIKVVSCRERGDSCSNLSCQYVIGSVTWNENYSLPTSF